MQEDGLRRRTLLRGLGTAVLTIPAVAQGAQDGPNFEVSVTHRPEIVDEGESGEVEGEITNTGTSSDIQIVELTITKDGQEIENRETTVRLDPGESVTQTDERNYDDYPGPGEYVAEVCSSDDCDTAEWAVVGPDGPAFFEVQLTDINEPSAGSSVNVSADITNRGGESDSQTITLDIDGLGTDETTVDLDPDGSTSVSFSVPTDDTDNGYYAVTVASKDHDDTTTLTVTEPPASFDVELTDLSNPTAGEPVEATVGVTNTGGSGEQSITLSVDGLGSDSTSVDLDRDGSTSVSLSVPTSQDDAGDYTATVSSDDDGDTGTVTVQEPDILTVEIADTNSPVFEGETLAVETTVENTGTSTITKDVSLAVGGDQRDEISVTLDAGATTMATLEWVTADGDAGDYTATVASADDEDTTDVAVQEPAAFTVDITDTNSPVVEGETLAVDATVENTGGTTATQDVSLSVAGDQRDRTSVSLDPGATAAVSLEWGTDEGDAGDYAATVESADDDDSADVAVEEPTAFTVEITDTNAPVVQGDTLTVEATVENVGEASNTEAVALSVGDTRRDETSVTLDAGDSTTVTLEWATAEGDAGDYTATVTSENATAERAVRIAEDESEPGPPPLPGQDDPPGDLNGDGLYRDIDGDGELTVRDVQVFFQRRESDAVRNNVDAFDFQPDGELAINDVQALFQDFLDS
jgi:acyl-CoA hydrolase